MRPLLEIPGLIVAFGLSLAAFFVGSRQRDAVIRDSNEFQEALALWHPAIRRAHPTPRSLKQFLNRLRLDAMRLRATAPIQPSNLPAQLRQRVEQWLGLGGAEPESQSSPAPGEIPESFLVALAVLSDRSPEIVEPATFRATWAGTSPAVDAVIEDGADRPRTLRDLICQHVALFGAPIDPEAHVERFASLREGTLVR